MATRVEEVLTQETETGDTSSQAEDQQTISTVNVPAAGPTEEDRWKTYSQTLEAAMADINRQLARTTQELDTARQQSNQPAVITPEEEKNNFFEQPIATLRKEMDAQLQPIREAITSLTRVATGIRGNQAGYAILDRVKLRPQFQRVWSPNIEKWVRAALDGLTEEQTNDTIVSNAVVQAIGLQASGLLEGAPDATPAPTREVQPVNRVDPPHMRPSGTPLPSNQPPAPRTRQLSENERRVMREQGFTSEAEYLAWLEEMPNNVISSPIGKPKK